MEIIFSSFDYDFCLICSRPLLQLFQFWAHINVRGGGGGGGGVGGGGVQKSPPTSFSPVASTRVILIPQNFLNFSFNPFATLV